MSVRLWVLVRGTRPLLSIAGAGLAGLYVGGGGCGGACGRTATVAGVHGVAPVLTSFVGWAGQVDEVAGLLGSSRLVTVNGR
jgi:hypothetical protein